MSFRRNLVVALATGGAVCSAGAETIQEGFESYAPGSFPAPPWLDVGQMDPSRPNPPDPSATVEPTTDAEDEPTQALVIEEAIGPTQGIYRLVGESCFFGVGADVRVDQWADPSADVNNTWAMQVGLLRFVPNTDAMNLPQLGIYASSLTHEWRVYASGTAGAFADFTLGIAIDDGTWYRIELELVTETGELHVEIRELATGTLLLDGTVTIPTWTPLDGLYDAILFVEGELWPDITMANVATVDNIDVQVGRLGDTDRDCVVGITDFLFLLGEWGPCADCDTPQACPADLDGDCMVGIIDFLILLENWG